MIDFIGLEIIEFHDVSIRAMYIEKALPTDFIIEIELWDEEIKSYTIKRIVFGGVNNIASDIFEINVNIDLEITSFDYYMKGEFFFGKMLFLCGFGKLSMNIEFSCQSVVVEEVDT